PSRSRTALSIERNGGWVLQFADAIADRAIGYSGRFRYGCNPAAAQRACFRGRPTPATALIQVADKSPVLLTNPFNNMSIWHGRKHPPIGHQLSRPHSVVNCFAMP